MRRILKKYVSKKFQYALLSHLRTINLMWINPFRNFRAKGFLKFLVDKRTASDQLPTPYGLYRLGGRDVWSLFPSGLGSRPESL